MITVQPGKYMNKYFGISTDVKPTDESVLNASSFFEMDTRNTYMYDRTNASWIIQAGNSGGPTPSGGGSIASSGVFIVKITTDDSLGVPMPVLDKTWGEIYEAMKLGSLPMVLFSDAGPVDFSDDIENNSLNFYYEALQVFYRPYDQESEDNTNAGYYAAFKFSQGGFLIFRADSPDGVLLFSSQQDDSDSSNNNWMVVQCYYDEELDNVRTDKTGWEIYNAITGGANIVIHKTRMYNEGNGPQFYNTYNDGISFEIDTGSEGCAIRWVDVDGNNNLFYTYDMDSYLIEGNA